MMKRYKCSPALVLLAAAAVLTGCQPAQKQTTASFLKEESIRLTEEMDRMAEDENYLEVYSGNARLNELAAEIGAADYSRPDTVYYAWSPEEAAFDHMTEGEKGEKMYTEEARGWIKQRTNSASIAGMINGRYGVEIIAVTTMLNTGRSYIMPEDWKENLLVVLMYDSGCSALVSFQESGEGVISSTAAFVKDEEDRLLSQLAEILPGVEFEAVAGG